MTTPDDERLAFQRWCGFDTDDVPEASEVAFSAGYRSALAAVRAGEPNYDGCDEFVDDGSGICETCRLDVNAHRVRSLCKPASRNLESAGSNSSARAARTSEDRKADQ